MKGRLGRLLLAFTVAAWLAASAAGCRRGTPPPQKPPVERTVVSLVPSVTETIFAMGLGSRQTGRSRFCRYPPEALSLPILGDAGKLDVERLLVMRPDLVVFNTSESQFYDRLTSAGIHCLAPPMETVEDVYGLIDLLGLELGAEAEARRLVERLRGELDAVGRAAGDATPVRTMMTFPSVMGGAGGIGVAGRGTFVDELLTLAGGRNVVDLARYGEIGPETAVTLAPELIIISTAGDVAGDVADEEYLRPWSRWQSIPAVKNGRVVVLREACLTLPGPRMGQAARLLLQVVHPERAARLEPVETQPQ